MSRPDLAVCPKCGKNDQVTFAPNVGRTGIYIGCVRCQNAIGGFRTHAEAFKAWAMQPMELQEERQQQIL